MTYYGNQPYYEEAIYTDLVETLNNIRDMRMKNLSQEEIKSIVYGHSPSRNFLPVMIYVGCSIVVAGIYFYFTQEISMEIIHPVLQHM
jgi:type VI protein secretion system component VasF